MLDKNTLITNLYTDKHDWLLQCAYNLTQNKNDADDLIGDLFLRLAEMDEAKINKMIFLNRELNLFYIFKMIKSMFINQQKKNSQQTFVDIDNHLHQVESEEYDENADNEFEELFKQTMDAMNDLHWFDRKMLETYIHEDHSIASLSNATKISKSTIFTSLKNSKTHIKEYVKHRK